MEFICTESDPNQKLFDVLYYSKETLDKELSDCSRGIESVNVPHYFHPIKEGVVPFMHVAIEFPQRTIYKISSSRNLATKRR